MATRQQGSASGLSLNQLVSSKVRPRCLEQSRQPASATGSLNFGFKKMIWSRSEKNDIRL